MLTAVVGVALGTIVVFFLVWLVLWWNEVLGRGASASWVVRSRASIALTVSFVVISLELMIVSQFDHKFRVYNQPECHGCPYENDHRPLSSIRGTEFERHWRWFVGSRSQKQTDLIKAGMKAELEDRRILAKADPATVRFMLFLAILLSPELLILAIVGGWWAPTAPTAMFCGLGAALCHDFLKMHLKYFEQFPGQTFPMALAIGVTVSLLAYVITRSVRRRRARA